MYSVGIVIPRNTIGTTVIGSFDLLNKVNQLQPDGKKLITPFFLSTDMQSVAIEGGIELFPETTFEEVKDMDWLIVPALGSDISQNISSNKALIPHIAEHHSRGKKLVSICTGAFLLAEAGVLEQKEVLTHWAFYHEFQNRYPGLKINKSKSIVDYGNLTMCGGAGLYEQLMLYLIEKHFGKKASNMLAKFSLMEKQKDALHFSTFFPNKGHHNERILSIQEYLERRYAQTITLDLLAEEFNISKRTLARNFKAATGSTPIEYLQKIRMEAAKTDLELTAKRVFEICYDCGYKDAQFFNKLFKKHVGITPTAYRRKYVI